MLKPLLLILLLASNVAFVQAQERFQIDLLVFARDAYEVENEEQWRTELRLRYPAKLIKLNPATRSTDEPVLNQDFVLHSLTDEDVDAVRTGIRRSRELRPLFAGSWQQPLVATAESPSLLIQGGKQFGLHHELEGSITISRDRYLHLNTNLWLTEFAPPSELHYYSDWPRLPLPFDTDAEVQSVAQEDLSLQNNQPQSDDPFAQNNAFGVKTSRARDPFAPQPDYEGQATNPLLTYVQNQTTRATFNPMAQVKSDGENTGGYLVKRTVELSQHRRMRSGELHFIDHPMVGLVLKVTTIEEQPSYEPASGDSVTQGVPVRSDSRANTQPKRDPFATQGPSGSSASSPTQPRRTNAPRPVY